MITLPKDKMPEAEVSLRLAFFLIAKGLVSSAVRVSIDGAQVQTNDTVHFPIIEFLLSYGWSAPYSQTSFQGRYRHSQFALQIELNAKPGKGDVVASLVTGQRLWVECKKGPLIQIKSSQEYSLLREAVGQLLTIEEVGESDVLAVAVPSSPKFEELAERWRAAPLVKRLHLSILTVNRNNEVNGLFDVPAIG